MRFGPVSFLFAVAAAWAATRAVMLWPDGSGAVPAPKIAWQPPLRRPSIPPDPIFQSPPLGLGSAQTDTPAFTRRPARPVALILAAESGPPALLNTGDAVPSRPVTPVHAPALPSSRKGSKSGWQVSAWAIVRDSGRGQSLAAAGQLGGAQAGARATYALGSGWALAARLSGPLASSRGKEAAVALDWRPAVTLPLTFTLERRAGLDRGGRDAFAAGAFGGFTVTLPLGATLDGYAQAGLVGLKRRDAYVDGAVRAERTIIIAGNARVAAGAGIWGGAQTGASRLDVGPQLVAHIPAGPANVRVSAEWRERVAGNARPGSGPALSIGLDF